MILFRSRFITPFCFILASLFLSVSPSFSEEGDRVTFEGIVGDISTSGGYLTINERNILLTDRTLYFDHSEHAIPSSDILSGKWVFCVAHVTRKGPEADKIYLLPKHVTGEELQAYPFMNDEGETEDGETE
jgi:hypothetical protein